jgi:hypothetical protein
MELKTKIFYYNNGFKKINRDTHNGTIPKNSQREREREREKQEA